jgi:hypothetical protein
MGLDLRPQLVQMLNDARVECTGKIGVLVRDDPRLVSDGVEHILETALTEELVSCTERNLDNTPELGELLGRIVLDIGDALDEMSVEEQTYVGN